MPQMMPMSWLLLMFFFSILYYIIEIILYFSFIKTNYGENMKFISYKFTMKW